MISIFLNIQVLAEHLSFLISSSAPSNESPDASASPSNHALSVGDLCALYRRQYGYQLRPENFGHSSVVTLLSELQWSDISKLSICSPKRIEGSIFMQAFTGF